MLPELLAAVAALAAWLSGRAESGRALSVYRGPLLCDDAAADGWALGPRARLFGKFLRVAEPLGRALEKGGLLADAAALYRRGLDGQPLAEPFCAGLMRCSVATGHASDAARIFEEYRATLATSRNAEPGLEIAGLYAQLVRPRVRERARPS